MRIYKVKLEMKRGMFSDDTETRTFSVEGNTAGEAVTAAKRIVRDEYNTYYDIRCLSVDVTGYTYDPPKVDPYSSYRSGAYRSDSYRSTDAEPELVAGAVLGLAAIAVTGLTLWFLKDD